MSKTLTCTNGNERDDGYLLNGKNDFNDSEEASVPKWARPQDDGIDELVVDVSVNTTKGNMLAYLNIVRVDAETHEFMTRTYSLSTKGGTLGLFDLLDDYFLRRFKFFHSSKTAQAFMCALADAEKGFRKRTGYTFFEYCAEVSDAAEKETLDKSGDERQSDRPMHDGYALRDSAYRFVEAKRRRVDMKLFDELASETVRLFVENMEYITTSGFAAVCATLIDGLPPALFTDPSVGLPMLVFLPKFAEVTLAKLAYSFMKTEAFSKAGIGRMRFETYALMPNATLGDVRRSIKSDGELIDYDSFAEANFVIGKHRDYSFEESLVDESGFDSIICYS